MRTGRIPTRPHGLVPDSALPCLNLPAEPLAREIASAVVLARSASGYVSVAVLSAA